MQEQTNAPISEPEKKGNNRTTVIIASIAGGVIALCVCLPVVVISVMRLLGPKIGNTFSTISSSLP
jgi:hypothetical protein